MSGMQKLRVEQIAGTSDSYADFGEQLRVMAEAWQLEVMPTNGQTVFTLDRQYTLGYNALKVYVNGVLQPPGTSYVETNPSTVTFNEPLYDTDVVVFRVEGAGSGTTFVSDHGHVYREIPQGAIDGINRIYTLSRIPIPGSEQVFINGILMNAEDDYIIAGDTLEIFEPALVEGEKLLVNYAYSLRR